MNARSRREGVFDRPDLGEAIRAEAVLADATSVLNAFREAAPSKDDGSDSTLTARIAQRSPEALAALAVYAEFVGISDPEGWSAYAPAEGEHMKIRRSARDGPIKVDFRPAMHHRPITMLIHKSVLPVLPETGASKPHHLEATSIADLICKLQRWEWGEAVRRSWAEWRVGSDRHNQPALQSLILRLACGGYEFPPREEEATSLAAVPEIHPSYSLVTARQRNHQSRFRRLLLRHYPHVCAYCGFDIPELLEAAHLIPDSEHGESSIENGRLLCPNHHAALDTHLLRWNPLTGNIEPDPDSPEIPPVRCS